MTPDLYGRHAATDNVCHRGDCVTCHRTKFRAENPGRPLPERPTSHRYVLAVTS